MTRPVVDYAFAESAVAPDDIADVASSIRANGYPANAAVAHENLNFLFNAAGQWIEFLAQQAQAFPSLKAARTVYEAGGLAEGSSFTVEDASTALGLIGNISTVGAIDNVDVHGYGGNIAVLFDTGDITVIGDDFSAVTSIASATATPQSLACGPNGLAVLDNATVKYYAYDGTLVWSYVHGAILTDVSIDGEYVYICGVSGTNADGTGTHRALNSATGVEVWTQAWGASLNSIYATGSTVLIGGNASGGFYGAEISRPAGTVIRNVSLPAPVTGKRHLVTDGVNFYAMCSGGLYVFPYSIADYSGKSAVANVGTLAIDDTFVYVRESLVPSNIKVYPKGQIAATTQVELRVQAGSATIRSLYSNGRRLIVGYDDVSGEAASVFATTGQNKRFQMHAAATEFLPTGDQFAPERINY